MKYAKVTLLLMAVSVTWSIILSGAVYATDSIKADATPLDHWLADSPLCISAYQRTPDGNGLAIVEVFNTSDRPVDVTEWYLEARYEALASSTTKTESVQIPIALHGTVSGLLAPGTHAVITLSHGIEVTNASYSANGFERPTWLGDSKTTPTKGQLVELALVPLSSDTEVDSYTLKSSSVKLNNVTTVVYDELWRRVPQSEAGYLSSFYATTLSDGGIYNDALYTSPQSPKSRIVEIYHHSESCSGDTTSYKCGDYIKLWVAAGDELDKLVVRTDNNSNSRTSTNTFALAARTVSTTGYLTLIYTDTDARLDLTDSGGTIWLEEVYGQARYDETRVTYAPFTDDNKDQAYIFIDDTWQWTTSPRPDASNELALPVEEVTTCPTGKYLNPETGRCRTLEEAVNALAACPEGQYRNPTTNRCKQLATTVTATLASCGEGQERNPTTNRCRSIASAVAELMPCDEGYERNPATNRCRKVATVLGTSAAGGVSENTPESSSPLAVWGWALAGVAGTGAVGYGVYEWRQEIASGWKSLKARIGRK